MDPEPEAVVFDGSDVVGSGGARGVTAETVVALAEASKARRAAGADASPEPAAARAWTATPTSKALLLAARAEGHAQARRAGLRRSSLSWRAARSAPPWPASRPRAARPASPSMSPTRRG